jgi:hypothetical protein
VPDGARSVHFEIVRVEAGIVSGDALPRQHATLHHRVGNVPGNKHRQFIKFLVARGGCVIGTNSFPPRKWSILLDQLVVLREWRHYQAPAHKSNVAYVHLAGSNDRDIRKTMFRWLRPGILADNDTDYGALDFVMNKMRSQNEIDS